MYAIVEIGGQQHKVKKAQKLYVNLLEKEEGANLEFDKVLLVDNEGEVSIGFPFIEGTRVAATVISHVKDDKVYIFKHKRRKGYRRFNGHRQPLTEIFIQGILGKGEELKESLPLPQKTAKSQPAIPETPVLETQPDDSVETTGITETAPTKKKTAAKKKEAATGKTESKAKAKKPAAKKSKPKKTKE